MLFSTGRGCNLYRIMKRTCFLLLILVLAISHLSCGRNEVTPRESTAVIECPDNGIRGSYIFPQAIIGARVGGEKFNLLQSRVGQFSKAYSLKGSDDSMSRSIVISYHPYPQQNISPLCGFSISISEQGENCYSVGLVDRSGIWVAKSVKAFSELATELIQIDPDNIEVLVHPSPTQNWDYRQKHQNSSPPPDYEAFCATSVTNSLKGTDEPDHSHPPDDI